MGEMQNEKSIQTVSLEDLKIMLRTLREVFDMVLVVDPMGREVWDIDSNGCFVRTGPATMSGTRIASARSAFP